MIHGIIFCLLNTNIDKHDNKEPTASVFLGLSPFLKICNNIDFEFVPS